MNDVGLQRFFVCTLQVFRNSLNMKKHQTQAKKKQISFFVEVKNIDTFMLKNIFAFIIQLFQHKVEGNMNNFKVNLINGWFVHYWLKYPALHTQKCSTHMPNIFCCLFCIIFLSSAPDKALDMWYIQEPKTGKACFRIFWKASNQPKCILSNDSMHIHFSKTNLHSTYSTDRSQLYGQNTSLTFKSLKQWLARCIASSQTLC